MHESPHICFVSDTIHTYFNSGSDKGIGGAERQQYLIANELQKSGYEISVVTLSYGDGNTEQINGITVVKSIPDKRGLYGAPFKTIAVLNALRKIDADIYYVRGNHFLCVLTAAYCYFTDSKFIYAVANDSDIEAKYLKEWNSLYARLYRRAIASADSVTALTPHQKDVLEGEHGIKSTVVPCGYDLPAGEEVLNHEDREYVLWVGRLDPDQKKPERYLRLAEKNPEISFVMIGPPDNDDENRSYFSSIKNRTESLENVDFIEFVPPDEIHEYFRKASLLVNTSDYEGFGNVFLEAWRYATPVVTLHYTLHGVIDEQPVGIHADSMDDLSKNVKRLHGNPDQRRQLGTTGRELVHEEYSMSAVAGKYRDIFASA